MCLMVHQTKHCRRRGWTTSVENLMRITFHSTRQKFATDGCLMLIYLKQRKMLWH